MRGWDQADLDRLLDEAEVGKEMAGRLERDETAFPRPRRDSVAAVLGVDPAWFTLPVEAILGGEAARDQRLERIEQMLEALLAAQVAEDADRAPRSASDASEGGARAKGKPGEDG